MVARPTRRQVFAVNCTAPACHDRRAGPGHSTSEIIIGRHEDLGTTENTEITERNSGGSVGGMHSDPRPFDPLSQLADVDLILLGRVSLLRILLSVISGHPKGRSVVIRSSYLFESSPGLSAPGSALRSWRAGAVPFTAKICRPVSRTTMADPPSAGGAFSPVSGR